MGQRMHISADISGLVGKTPVIYLNRLRGDRPGIIAAKLEWFNPSGSIKDRMVAHMLREAETRGLIKPGDTIIESTSGNTGISLAAFAARNGYRVVLTMPETTSRGRTKILAMYGAEIVLTPAKEGMRGAILAAQQAHERTPGSYMLRQFVNQGNPRSHMRTTAHEIWKDTRGQVRAVVAGIGTGGTISGIGRALKKMDPTIRTIGVEPKSLAVFTAPGTASGRAGGCGIDGIGAGFVPRTYDPEVVDEVLAVDEADAIRVVREMARQEGVLAGASSGVAVSAALRVAERKEFKDKLIVVICPDNGLKYLDTELFE